MSAIHDIVCPLCDEKLGTYDVRDGDTHTLIWVNNKITQHVAQTKCFRDSPRRTSSDGGV